MEKYIKANKKVAEFLHLQTIRNAVKDGHYLLWIMDVQPFGNMEDLPNILQQIGGLLLSGSEAKEEQDGTVTRKLPTPLDKRFIMDDDVQKTTEGSGEVTDTPETDKAGETTGSEGGNGNGENGNSSDTGTESGSEDDPDQKKEGGINE